MSIVAKSTGLGRMGKSVYQETKNTQNYFSKFKTTKLKNKKKAGVFGGLASKRPLKHV